MAGAVRRALLSLFLTVACDAAAEPSAPAPPREAPGETAAGTPAPLRDEPDLGGLQERTVVLPDVRVPGVLPRRVVIVRPPGDAPGPHPVLVVHDGQMIGPDSFRLVETLDALARRGLIAPQVIVAIESTEQRRAEYTISGPSVMGLSAQARTGRRPPGRTADQRYVDFVAEHVLPLAASHASIDPARGRTATLGFSYGGLAALHLAMRWPERFGRVVCLSPSLWWRQREAIDAFRSYTGPLPVRLWVDAGTLEGAPGDVVPYMVRDARALRDAAIARGLRPGRELGYLEAPLAEHFDGAVAERLPSALGFALSDRRIDLERDARDMSFLLFDPVFRAGQATATSIALRTEDGIWMTPPPGSTRFRVEGPAVRVEADGRVRALPGPGGTSTVVARVGALERSMEVRVTGQLFRR